MISGLIIQSFPQDGLGSSAESRRNEINSRPIHAPTSIRLPNDAWCDWEVELFVCVMSIQILAVRAFDSRG
jgi:hypothetical protein